MADPKLTSSSDCSTEILCEQDSNQDKLHHNILENNICIKTENKEIVLSSKLAVNNPKDIIYVSTWNKMWLELVQEISKN